ncbi:MAG: hemolysin family protein, partial [Vicinamibacteria bacterium]
NELVNVAVSVVVASLISSLFAGKSWASWGVILALSTLTAAPLLLLVGEITPKTIAMRNPERWAFGAVRPLYLWSTLISPLRAVFTYIVDRSMALFGIAAPTEERVVLEEEFRTLVDVGRQEGVVDEKEKELIDKVFKFGDITVERLMTPRTEIASLSSHLSLEQVLAEIRASRYSRIPVYEAEEDNVIGLLYAKDLLRVVYGPTKPEAFNWLTLLRKAYFVPAKKKADRLMAEFRQTRSHFAVVVDEFGGVAGVVSLEDLLEEVFGEIFDEYDKPERTVFVRGKDTYRIRATMSVEDFNRRFKTSVPQENGGTIGGFVLNLFGRLPDENATIRHGNIEFEVVQMDGKRIAEVEVRFKEVQ